MSEPFDLDAAVSEAVGEPFRFTLVKGRRNYVSIRRALLARDNAVQLFDEQKQAELATLVDAGRLRVPLERIYPLTRVAAAQRDNQRGRTRGKLAILVVDEPAER